MNEHESIQKTVSLQPQIAAKLSRLAEAQHTSEDLVVEKALAILFNLTELLSAPAERAGWSALSEESLSKTWDNEEDARYDDWRELYDVQSR